MTSYNLLDEKWIRVTDKEGTIKAVSVKDCILNGFNYAEISSPIFHGYRFFLYDFLALRLLSAIAADILLLEDEDTLMEEDDTSVWHYIVRELKNGKPTEKFKQLANKYLELYHDRFDLFDEEHPFMQFNESELKQFGAVKKSPGNMLKINPIFPAESGRIFPESFDREIRPCKSVNFSGAFDTFDGVKDTKKQILEMVQKNYTVPPEEAAYIALYLSSLCPGVGAGNKSALAGNAYIYETLRGENLWETIMLNIPIDGELLENDEKNESFGIPIWRWTSTLDVEKSFYKGDATMHTLDGVFFPCRGINFYYDETERCVQVKYAAIPKNFIQPIDSMRKNWATYNEPYALQKQTYVTDDKESVNNDTENPYRKLAPGDSLGMLLAATAQTENTKVLEYRKKEVTELIQNPAASNNIIMKLSADKNIQILPEKIRVRYYYRMADPKWVYYKTGIEDGEIDKSILMSQVRQQCVVNVKSHIDYVSNTLCDTYKHYLVTTGKVPGNVDEKKLKSIDVSYYKKEFMNRLDYLFTRENSFLTEIGEADESELDDVSVKWQKTISDTALDQFRKSINGRNLAVFWDCYSSLDRRTRVRSRKEDKK